MQTIAHFTQRLLNRSESEGKHELPKPPLQLGRAWRRRLGVPSRCGPSLGGHALTLPGGSQGARSLAAVAPTLGHVAPV
jgi:hypothetical protein